MGLKKLDAPKGQSSARVEAEIVNIHADVAALDTRTDALEAADVALDLRVDAAEAAITALAAADTALDARLDVVELRSKTLSFHALASAQATWVAMPAAATLLGGSPRHIKRADLTGFTQIRILVNKTGTAGFAGSKFVVRYFTSYSTTASDYLDAGTSIVAAAIDVTTFAPSAWVNLAAGAKADVYLAIIGLDGDGIVSPQYGALDVEVR